MMHRRKLPHTLTSVLSAGTTTLSKVVVQQQHYTTRWRSSCCYATRKKDVVVASISFSSNWSFSTDTATTRNNTDTTMVDSINASTTSNKYQLLRYWKQYIHANNRELCEYILSSSSSNNNELYIQAFHGDKILGTYIATILSQYCTHTATNEDETKTVETTPDCATSSTLTNSKSLSSPKSSISATTDYFSLKSSTTIVEQHQQLQDLLRTIPRCPESFTKLHNAATSNHTLATHAVTILPIESINDSTQYSDWELATFIEAIIARIARSSNAAEQQQLTSSALTSGMSSSTTDACSNSDMDVVLLLNDLAMFLIYQALHMSDPNCKGLLSKLGGKIITPGYRSGGTDHEPLFSAIAQYKSITKRSKGCTTKKHAEMVACSMILQAYDDMKQLEQSTTTTTIDNTSTSDDHTDTNISTAIKKNNNLHLDSCTSASPFLLKVLSSLPYRKQPHRQQQKQQQKQPTNPVSNDSSVTDDSSPSTNNWEICHKEELLSSLIAAIGSSSDRGNDCSSSDRGDDSHTNTTSVEEIGSMEWWKDGALQPKKAFFCAMCIPYIQAFNASSVDCTTTSSSARNCSKKESDDMAIDRNSKVEKQSSSSSNSAQIIAIDSWTKRTSIPSTTILSCATSVNAESIDTVAVFNVITYYNNDNSSSAKTLTPRQYEYIFVPVSIGPTATNARKKAGVATNRIIAKLCNIQLPSSSSS